jgi:hypothetical protein
MEERISSEAYSRTNRHGGMVEQWWNEYHECSGGRWEGSITLGTLVLEVNQ